MTVAIVGTYERVVAWFEVEGLIPDYFLTAEHGGERFVGWHTPMSANDLTKYDSVMWV